MMTTKQARNKIATIIFVFLVGMLIIFASFALGGFPYPGETFPQIIWVELVFLIFLLGIPLLR